MKRIQLDIVLGTILAMLSSVIVVYLGFKEPQRMVEYERMQQAERIEFGASVFETNCTRCHGEQAQGIPGIAPCLRCEELFTTRLEEVGWEGGLEDYIVSVVTTGRQVSTRPDLYQGFGRPVMPTWSEKFGGPLREDQIGAVASYIMNFEPYALGDVPAPVPLEPLPEESEDPTVRGRVVFAQAGCNACHTISGLSTATVGPALDGLASRAGERKEGYTAEEYIRESILDPNAFMVEGFHEDVMPQIFGEQLSDQQIDDLVAFLLTLEE